MIVKLSGYLPESFLPYMKSVRREFLESIQKFALEIVCNVF